MKNDINGYDRMFMAIEDFNKNNKNIIEGDHVLYVLSNNLTNYGIIRMEIFNTYNEALKALESYEKERKDTDNNGYILITTSNGDAGMLSALS